MHYVVLAQGTECHGAGPACPDKKNSTDAIVLQGKVCLEMIGFMFELEIFLNQP